MRRSAAEAMLVGTVTLWAFNFTVSKYILDKGFHPLAYSSVRYAAAALIFFAFTIAIEGTVRLARTDVVLAAFATFALLLNQLCFIYSLRFTTATTVALLFGTLPIFTAIDRVGPSHASLFANLQPFLAAVIALIVLSESITSLQVAGGLALAGGILLAPRVSPPQPDAD